MNAATRARNAAAQFQRPAERWRGAANGGGRAASRGVASVLLVAGLAGYDAWELSTARWLRGRARQRRAGRRAALGRTARVASVAAAVLAAQARRRARLMQPNGPSRRPTFRSPTAPPRPTSIATLAGLKDEAPQLAGAIRTGRGRPRPRPPRRRWQAVRAEAAALAPDDDPEAPLAAVRAFLKEFPDTPKRDEALACPKTLKPTSTPRAGRCKTAGSSMNSTCAEGLPNAELRDLDRPRLAVPHRPPRQRVWRAEVEGKLEALRSHARRPRHRPRTLIFARSIPRISPPGSSAIKITCVRTRPADATFQRSRPRPRTASFASGTPTPTGLAYDHLAAHPDDVAETARRLRDYLHDHRDGRYANDAQQVSRLVGQGLCSPAITM